MRQIMRLWTLLATLTLFVVGGVALLSQGPGPLPGDPLPQLMQGQINGFRAGQEEFLAVRDPIDGLGPAYSGTSCAACHNIPATGGAGLVTVTRAGRQDDAGNFIPLPGGSLFQLFSIPNNTCQAQIPAEANVIAHRLSIPLFGIGLIEAIPDETLIAMEDPDDRDGDGIRGRAARIVDVATGQPRIGRFGWKAQHATLLSFAAQAFRDEMGITNDLFRDEMALGVSPEHLKLCDTVADPEDVKDRRTGLRGIDRLETYLRYLAPTAAVQDDAALGGAVLFKSAGCSLCHAPVLTTGISSDPVFDRKPVALYSDLLLHDVGTGDGIAQEAAGPGEFRTPYLWGLRFRRPLLHDGSAATVDQAIRRHSGEAAGVIQKYLDLSSDERSSLMNFLMTL
jgi:CxxC motif-containing protein (DUF1111 family)